MGKDYEKEEALKQVKTGLQISSFFGSFRRKNKDVETYEDYDTDENEDLETEPRWMSHKYREIINNELEDHPKFKPSKKLKKVPLKWG